MPPLPMSSRISSCGKSLASSSTVGGMKGGRLAPADSTPVGKPDLMRHSGQRPSGTSGASGFWQLGQMRSVSIMIVASTQFLGIAGERLQADAKETDPSKMPQSG